MRKLPILIACLALAFATPALAFKNVEGCDIVAFAASSSPLPLPEERWQDYRQAAEQILAHAPQEGTSLQDWRALADELIAAQASLLQPVKALPAYGDYLAGNSCSVLARLDGKSVSVLLNEAAQGIPAAIAESLRAVVEAARNQIDRIERTARFSSNRAKTLMAAQYYCFVAAAIVAFLPPDRRADITLDDFGQTVSCQDAGRTG